MNTSGKKVLGAKLEAAGATYPNKKVHVVIWKGKWTVLKGGTGNIEGMYINKNDAVEKATQLLNSGEAEKIIVHFHDGTVEKVKERGE